MAVNNKYYFMRDEKDKQLIETCNLLYEGNFDAVKTDLSHHLSINSRRIYPALRKRIEEDILRIERIQIYRKIVT